MGHISLPDRLMDSVYRPLSAKKRTRRECLAFLPKTRYHTRMRFSPKKGDKDLRITDELLYHGFAFPERSAGRFPGHRPGPSHRRGNGPVHRRPGLAAVRCAGRGRRYRCGGGPLQSAAGRRAAGAVRPLRRRGTGGSGLLW